MSVQTINTNNKSNCCPHGLPVGMCPICSGMGGGVKKSATNTQKANQWSYAKCYAFWQRTLAMKAQKEADIRASIIFQQNLAVFQKNIQNFIDKITVSMLALQDKLPLPLAKTLNLISQKLLLPLLNLLEKLPDNVQKFMQEIPKIMADISDKLAAIFGELKLSIEKRLQNSLKKLKKSVFSLLAIFGFNMDEDEEKKVDEAKRIFDLKVLKQNMMKIKEDENE